MTRQLGRENIKAVIEALRQGPKRWTDLKELDIKDTSLRRILKDYLSFWGLARKSDNRWAWYDYLQEFKSEEEYKAALRHSKQLVPGLRTILREHGHPEEDYPEMSPEDLEHLKAFAERHLATGYPEIYKMLTDFREEKNRIINDMESPEQQDRVNYLIESGMSGVYIGSEHLMSELPEEIKLVEDLIRKHDELPRELRILSWKTKWGEPLKGKCRLCPDFKITGQ